jgi:hypothetical protein
MTHYSFHHDLAFRAWKIYPGILPEPHGGHIPVFPSDLKYKVWPKKFVIRHYQFREKMQALKRINERIERSSGTPERKIGWHGHLQEINTFPFSDPVDHSILQKYEEDNNWNLEFKFGFNPTVKGLKGIFAEDGSLKPIPTYQELKLRNKKLRKEVLELRQLKFRIATTEKIFTDIYNENKWGNKESRSGPGSTLTETETMRSKLPELLEEYHIHSILDIPCGDFNWMKEVNLDSISYIGADIVEKIIQFNNEEYSKENRKFVKIDILKDELPQVDLIFCRDLFIHFSYRHIFTAIENIKKSGSKYLLTTSNRPEKKNFDILTGQWHPINLLIKPLSFPSPLKVVDEKSTREADKGKSLLLWKIRDLKLKMV